MATKSVLKIEGCDTKVIGMMQDGTLANLEATAKRCLDAAHTLRVLTKFKKGDPTAILKAMEHVVTLHQDSLFLCNPNELQWVRWSVLYQPTDGECLQYDGYMDLYLGHSKIG